MTASQHIAAWVSDSYEHGRDILRGVLRYARQRSDWRVLRPPPTGRSGRRWLRQADGIIAFINTPARQRPLEGVTVPVVNVAASWPEYRGVIVANDDHAIGRLGAEYLLDRGYRSFAYIGLRHGFAPALEQGFAAGLSDRGCTCTRLLQRATRGPGDGRLDEPDSRLLGALAHLPQRTAVFTVFERVSIAVVKACHQLQRAIPDDIAVLGVNNDELLCESVTPPLSSIQTAGEQIGHRAAEVLAGLLAGAASPPRPILLPPIGVVTRASTGTLAVSDPLVAEAMQLICARADRPTTVEDLLDDLMVSRKTLERRFAEHLGRTPLAEIQRVHLQRVQHLLAETDAPMGEVARRCGFARAQHMATLFRRAVGMTPSAYRGQFRKA